MSNDFNLRVSSLDASEYKITFHRSARPFRFGHQSVVNHLVAIPGRIIISIICAANKIQ